MISFNDNAKRRVSFTTALLAKRQKVREVKQVDQRHPFGKWHRWSVSSGLLLPSPQLCCFIPFCLLSTTAAVSAVINVGQQDRSWPLEHSQVSLRTKRESEDFGLGADSLMGQRKRLIRSKTRSKWFLVECWTNVVKICFCCLSKARALLIME